MDVRSALFALPVRLRIPMVLHHYSDLSSKEIGHIVGAPSATIRFRLAQARRSMQRLLRENDTYGTRPKEVLQ
jgi:RNA polymerase sigma-70 factor (ECF subfamily)